MNRRNFFKVIGVAAMVLFVPVKSVEPEPDYGAFAFWDNASDDALAKCLASIEHETSSCNLADILNSEPADISDLHDCPFEIQVRKPCALKGHDCGDGSYDIPDCLEGADVWFQDDGHWVKTASGEYWKTKDDGATWLIQDKDKGKALYITAINKYIQWLTEMREQIPENSNPYIYLGECLAEAIKVRNQLA